MLIRFRLWPDSFPTVTVRMSASPGPRCAPDFRRLAWPPRGFSTSGPRAGASPCVVTRLRRAKYVRKYMMANTDLIAYLLTSVHAQVSVSLRLLSILCIPRDDDLETVGDECASSPCSFADVEPPEQCMQFPVEWRKSSRVRPAGRPQVEHAAITIDRAIGYKEHGTVSLHSDLSSRTAPAFLRRSNLDSTYRTSPQTSSKSASNPLSRRLQLTSAMDASQ